MHTPCQIEISHRERILHSFRLSQPVVLGRQLSPTEPQWQLRHHAGSGDERMAIAPFSDVRVSRRQLLLRPGPEGVEVENTSTNPVLVDNREELAPTSKRLIGGPCRLSFGPDASYVVSLWPAEAPDPQMQTLPHQAPAPSESDSDEAVTALAALKLSENDANAVRLWLKAITEVLQSAAGRDDFLQRAVRRVVSLMGFDAARVFLLRDGQWHCQAEHRRGSLSRDTNAQASRRILERMREERKTVWRDAMELAQGDFSQAGFDAIICSPVCDRHGQVIGALYADRRSGYIEDGVMISRSEAMLVETIAYGIAAGLERESQEKQAVEQRVRFEQFFTRDLAEKLAADPALLVGKDAQVTMLVVDIRGFSAISERLDTRVTLEWIQDTLDMLTSVVNKSGGVVIDYVGDEMMAMFGAPIPQEDQARRACRAALEILVGLGPLNAAWQDRIQAETQVGIGIHTGVAQVGNVGSRVKFKYGALGHTVNLASRVQGANKHLRTSLLVTRDTHQQLGPGFVTRRICALNVQNIEQPVDVFELRLADDERGRTLCQLYEKALDEFEQQDFRRAARTLGDFLPNYQDDGPSHILLWRAVNWLVNPAPTFDRAWKLPGK